MFNPENLRVISDSICASKKYHGVYRKTVARIVKDCLMKYPDKEAEKRARNILHQVWALYYGRNPGFEKILSKIQQDVVGAKPAKEIVTPILALQSSTKERIPLLDTFYQQIFVITGVPETIIDHGCGLNPLTFYWMGLSPTAKYYGYDIDENQINFLQASLGLLNNKQVVVGLGDALTDRFPQADVVFMLKLLPPLEQQGKGLGLMAMESQQCRYLVVSYPTRSLSGWKRKMADFYEQQFYGLVKGKPWQVEKLLFDSELVFVIKK